MYTNIEKVYARNLSGIFIDSSIYFIYFIYRQYLFSLYIIVLIDIFIIYKVSIFLAEQWNQMSFFFRFWKRLKIVLNGPKFCDSVMIRKVRYSSSVVKIFQANYNIFVAEQSWIYTSLMIDLPHQSDLKRDVGCFRCYFTYHQLFLFNFIVQCETLPLMLL